MRWLSAAGDPRLWVAVGLGSLLICLLAAAFALVLDAELDRREAAATPLPAAVAEDTGAAARRAFQEQQAQLVAEQLRRAQQRAAPPDPYILRNQPPVPMSASRPIPVVAAAGCGAMVLVVGLLGTLLLRGRPSDG